MSLKPGNKSDLLLTSSRANSAAGWQAWPPCHPPLPPIGNIPPICNSSNPCTIWYLDAGSRTINQTNMIQCNDIDLLEFRRWLTQVPEICEEQMVFGIMSTWSIPVIYINISLSMSHCFFYPSIISPNEYPQRFMADQRIQNCNFRLFVLVIMMIVCALNSKRNWLFFFLHFMVLCSIHSLFYFCIIISLWMLLCSIQFSWAFCSLVVHTNDSIAWMRVKMYLRCKNQLLNRISEIYSWCVCKHFNKNNVYKQIQLS